MISEDMANSESRPDRLVGRKTAWVALELLPMMNIPPSDLNSVHFEKLIQ